MQITTLYGKEMQIPDLPIELDIRMGKVEQYIQDLIMSIQNVIKRVEVIEQWILKQY